MRRMLLCIMINIMRRGDPFLYNDYECPRKDELPIIFRETLGPCDAVFHLIGENITFLISQKLLGCIVTTIVIRMDFTFSCAQRSMFGLKIF